MIILVYIILLLPSVIFVEDIIECLSIYAKPTGSYEQLTLNHPNIYTFLQYEILGFKTEMIQ